MSKNQEARHLNDIYEHVKKFDVNALRSFMYQNTKDITDAIQYWSIRRLTLIKPEDKNQIILVDMEIMRLEAILMAKTQLTVDFFKIEEITGIMSEAEVLSKYRSFPDSKMPLATSEAGREHDLPFQENKKRWGCMTIANVVKDMFASHKTDETIKSEIRNIIGGCIVDFGNNEELDVTSDEVFNKYFTEHLTPLLKEEPKEEGAKVIQMLPDTMKLSDLHDKVKSLLTEGKDSDAFEFSKKYLSAGNYTPNKKKQKPETWLDERITSWIADIKKHVKVVTKEVENPTPSVEKTAPDATSTTKDIDSVPQKTEEDKPIYISVSIEDTDKLFNYLTSKDVNPEDIWGAELTAELKDSEKRKKYSNLQLDLGNPEKAIADLKIAGIEAIIAVDEEEEEELNANTFLNEGNTLTEEIQHVENLINICKEFRGDEDKHANNMNKVEEVTTLFLSTRPANEYKNKKEFINIIRNRPKIMTNAKDFFSIMCYSKLTPYTENSLDSATGKTTNLYEKIYKEIADACRNADFEEVFVPNMVNKLKGTMLLGASKDDKNVLVNKNYFYTSYHVLHFIDLIAESVKSNHPQNPLGELAATVTNAVANVPTEQVTAPKETKDTVTTVIPEKVLTPTEKLDEALYLLVKNGGLVSDALKHDVILSLKGEEFADIDEVGKVKLTDENYDKYITAKYTKALEAFVNSMTEYPAGEMLRLITMAHGLACTPEQFVKDNLHLLARKDNKYLPIVGEVDDVKISVKINSEADFLKYVKDAYEIQNKLIENEKVSTPNTNYELSVVKSYKNMEETLTKKVKEEKMKLSDLQKWAKDNILNKLFEDEVRDEPMFNGKHPEVLETYIEAFTRKLYETPESILLAQQKLEEYIKKEIKESKLSLITFVNQVVTWCRKEKIDFNLSAVRNQCATLAKTENKEMYDKYTSLRKNLEMKEETFDKTPITKETPVTETAKVEEKKVIVESTNTEDVKGSPMEKELSNVKTKAEVETVLAKYKFKSHEIPVLKSLKSILCDKKQVPDMKLSEAELNEYVTKYYKDAPAVEAEPEAVPTAQIDFVPDVAKEDLENLSSANDKPSFKEALANIVNKFHDSTETRNAIMTAINSGKGSHTVKVAKNGVTEQHKMIKKAYENYAEENKVEAS